MRKATFLPAFAVVMAGLLLFGACVPVGAFVVGSGNTVTKDMDLSNFNAIEGHHAFQLDVKQGDTYKVSVTADDNLWDQVDVHTSGQSLVLQLKPGNATNTHLSAQITMPSLSGITLSGASHATLSGFKDLAGNVPLRCSGASGIDGELQGDSVTFELSGASTASLRGGATSAQINGSGASTANLGDFPVDKAAVQLSGASNATVNVKSNLDYDLSGASNLIYSGSPSIGKSQASGASNATHR